MRCPQLRNEEVRKDFNDVLTRLGGKEMAVGDVAPRRAYLDGLSENQRSAYHVAHYLWDAYPDPAAIGAHLSAYDKVRDALGISGKPVPTFPDIAISPEQERALETRLSDRYVRTPKEVAEGITGRPMETEEFLRERERGIDEQTGKIPAANSNKRGPFGLAERGETIEHPNFTDLGQFDVPEGMALAEAAQRDVLERGRLTNLEHLVAIDEAGNVVSYGRGSENRIGMSPALETALRDPTRSVVIHHNHPNNQSLSNIDLAQLPLPGLKSVWAHGHGGAVSRAELTPKAREIMAPMPGGERTVTWGMRLFYSLARDASDTIYRAVLPKVRAKAISVDDANALHQHFISLAFDRAGIIDYRTNIDAGAEIARLGLDEHINRAAADARWQLFHEKTEAPVSDRRAGPLRHPGDVGTALGRPQEVAGRYGSQTRHDRPRRADDRAQKGGRPDRSGEQLTLPGFEEESGRLATEGTGGPPNEPPSGGEPPESGGGPPERKGPLTVIRDKADRFVEQLGNIVRDIQIKTTPMAARDASIEARAIAKDFANAMRQSRATWDLVDQKLAKDFTPAQQERMWTAADAESVAKQKGEEVGDKGIAGLPEAERKVVELLQAHGEEKFAEAKALGIFKGEGLPSYVPRMVVKATGEGSYAPAGAEKGPTPSLDTIGHGVRTTTPQMRQRKHLTAEETEEAAKKKLGEDVELVRNIRTLPLAIARLEEAIAGRALINRIKEIGRQAADATVHEGAMPNSPHRWFTIDHPAFKTFQPKYVRDGNGEVKLDDRGKVMVVKDANGEVVLEKVPIYVRGDFEGPLRAVLSQQDGRIYRAFMALKTRIITMIMMSPMIHNQVEWGRALPAAPGKVFTGRIYFEGNKAKKDPAQLREAVTDGLAPIGRRGYQMDITSIAEGPDLKPGRSWTSQLLAFVPGLYNKEAGVATKRAIDKAGDFWHNTLLWDRIGDLQMGLYVNLRDHLIEKGFDRKTASRAAAHWANRYAGALPVEAMSGMARKIANFLMFSRSFTLGNIGAMKDMFVGLPRDVRAQIERDAGLETLDRIKGLARRKAAMIVATDIAMFYVMTSLTQSAINVLGVKGAAATLGGTAAGGVLGSYKGKFPGLALALAGGALGYLITDGDDDRKKKLKREIEGYFRRAAQLMKRIREHPFEVVNPFGWPGMAQSVSSTAENEPGRQDRILVGYQKDGTAIYMRWPVGKIGEEFIGYGTGPLEMIHKKMSTWARPLSEIFSNDRGFGRPVYDKNAETGAEQINNVRLITWHLLSQQLPVDWAESLWDLEHGKGDKTTNLLKTVGPLLGATFSKGAPGGPAMGELYRSEEKFRFRLTQELPALRKQIQAGDIDGAVKRMQELHVPEKLIEYHVGAALDPRSRLGTRRIERFMQSGSPDITDRFIRQLERGGELQPKEGRNLGLAPKNPNWRPPKSDPGVFDSKGQYVPPAERQPAN